MSRAPPGRADGMAGSENRAMGAAGGWLYEDSWDWTIVRTQSSWLESKERQV